MATLCTSSLIFCGFLALGIYGGFKLFQKLTTQRKLNRWRKTPKDVVILHAPPRGRRAPNLSPFTLKVETYCRMANIPYKVDYKDPIGPKGKTPWITYNGQHIADSQLIIEFLGRKLDKNFSNHCSDEQLAIATAVRVMLEEYFYWGIRFEGYVYGNMKTLRKACNLPTLELWLMKMIYGFGVRNATIKQGLGRHTRPEITEMMAKTLKAVSKILGNKKFICGDEPCEHDCGIFGILSTPVWTMDETVYGKLINDELPNLQEYCIRMKEKFWPDWELCLAR